MIVLGICLLPAAAAQRCCKQAQVTAGKEKKKARRANWIRNYLFPEARGAGVVVWWTRPEEPTDWRSAINHRGPGLRFTSFTQHLLAAQDSRSKPRRRDLMMHVYKTANSGGLLISYYFMYSSSRTRGGRINSTLTQCFQFLATR